MLEIPITKQFVDAKEQLKQVICRQIELLAKQADVYVFALYAADQIDIGPISYKCYDKKRLQSPEALEIDLNFDGIGVWYICFRNADTFRAKHILVQAQNGHFVNQQMGTFDGYWEDWPSYVAEDRWVQDLMIQKQAQQRAQQYPQQYPQQQAKTMVRGIK